MDPVSAAGLGLAILPLIVSALENYERLFQPIIIFTRDCRKEVERFHLQLRVHRVVFTNQCQLLLCTVAPYQYDVPTMFKEPEHRFWRDVNFDTKLKIRLGESFEACVAALTLVQRTLEHIINQYGGLEMLLTRSQDEPKKSFLRRLKRIRQRSKISFTKPDIDQAIEELRKGNDDIVRLSDQIGGLAKAEISPVGGISPAYAEFCIIQKASKKLHEALSKVWSCPAEHTASLSLEIRKSNTNRKASSTTVSFDIAWTCLAGAQATDGPLWLTVETFADSATHDATTDQEAFKTSAQALVAALGETSLGKASSRTIDMPQQPSTLAGSHLDLSSINDLCLHLRRQQKPLPAKIPDAEATGPCVGFLQKPNTTKHLVFQGADSVRNRCSMSLQEALSKAKALRYGGISQVERIHLAKILSTAVLQYHSTPWLENEWQSSDVLFFGVEDLNKDSLTAPYLSACPINAVRSTEQRLRRPNHTASTLNPIIYNLGVMLIEVAFERPLKDMQEPGDYRLADSESQAFQRTALRLAEVVHRKINVKYADTVKRCLRCHFGPDVLQMELENVELQRAFYKDVICQLERCYQAVAMF